MAAPWFTSSTMSSRKTTKELLNIATRHASGEEAVGAAFVLGNTGVAANGGRAALTRATIKGARKGAKGGNVIPGFYAKIKYSSYA
jgi:hypothetical protein